MKVDHFHVFSTSMLVYPEVPEVTPKEAGVIATTTVDPISSLASRLYHLPLRDPKNKKMRNCHFCIGKLSRNQSMVR